MGRHFSRDEEDGRKVVTVNRRVGFDFEIIDRLETGIVLTGTEVKAVREGKANIRDAYAAVKNGELWLIDLSISAYSHTGYSAHEPTRPRKLLLHSTELTRWRRKEEEKGYTMVPYSLYFKRGFLKVDLCLVRGRRKYDKREALKEKDLRRSRSRGEED